MLANVKKSGIAIMLLLVFFAVDLRATDESGEGVNPEVNISVFPPRVIKYPAFSDSLDSISLHLKSDRLHKNVMVRLHFPGNESLAVDFFSSNIQWKKEGKYYYLTNIYGKKSEIPIVENFYNLEIKYKFVPEKYVRGSIELLIDDTVIKTIPVDFLSRFDVGYLWRKVSEQVSKDPRQKYAIILLLLLALWVIYDFGFRRRMRKNIPVCSTRARFSTLVEQNQVIKIEETNNPFGCRLGGLSRKIKIEYRHSDMLISISGKKTVYPDNAPVDIHVNEVWKLHIEAQNYFGNDNQSHKNLVVLLLPL